MKTPQGGFRVYHLGDNPTMQWVRWHHGTVTDPKWRVVAKRAQVSIADVVAVWAMMLEAASANENERGTIAGWDHEDVAFALDLETEAVERIWNIMQGKVLEGQRLTGWSNRNPKREDDSSERVQRYRHRVTHGNARKRTVTHGNAVKRDVTPDKIREEKRREELTTTSSSSSTPKVKRTSVPKYPQYPDEICDQLFESYKANRGNVAYATFRKWTAPLFPNDYTTDQLIHAMEAWCEYVEGIGPEKAKWEKLPGWVENINRWARVGEMPLVDWNGVTERGRLCCGIVT